MTPRPFLRWKSVWLGLFALAFLAWAVGESYRRQVVVTYSGPAKSCGFVRHNATSSFFWNALPHTRGFRAYHAALPTWVEAEPGFSRIRAHGGTVLHVSDDAVIGGFIVVWIAWLGWRIRRCRLEIASGKRIQLGSGGSSSRPPEEQA